MVSCDAGLSVEQPVLLGSEIIVKASANEVRKGKYVLHVVEGAEHHVFVEMLSDYYISPSWGKMIDVGH